METPSVRVLVVGDSGVGKTTLLRSLCRPQSRVPAKTLDKPPTTWTAGCDVHVLLKSLGPDGRDVFVEFLDVGGHRQYERSRRAFYVDVHGVLFVHDLSNAKSGDHLSQWSRELSAVQRAKGCVVPSRTGKTHGDVPTLHALPKLVVGSKRDLVAANGAARAAKRIDVVDGRPVSCLEACAEPLAMEPSGAFDAFLRQTVAFAHRKDAATSHSSYDQSSTGLRQLSSRTVDAEESRPKGTAESDSAVDVLPLLPTDTRSAWW